MCRLLVTPALWLRIAVLSATMCGCAVLDAPPPPAPVADATSVEALVEVMGQRLALMPQVAEWKRAHDQPVRDRPRELVVLNGAVKAIDTAAKKAGVTPFPEDDVRRFYQAQIDTAVGIQDQVLSQPSTSPDSNPPNLDTVIRPELLRLGTRIAELLVAQSGSPHLSRLESLAQQHWQVEGLEPEAISRLVDALARLLDTTPLSRASQN